MTASIDERALTARVGEVLNRWPVAGLAVGVIRDGSLAWFYGHGVADIRPGTPVGPDTVFRIASVTKTITAVAVMQLQEQGLVDLDAPACRYLRAFRLIPARPGFRPATLRHLLTHTAGVRAVRKPSDLLRPALGWGVPAGPAGAPAGRVLPGRPAHRHRAGHEVGLLQSRVRRARPDRRGRHRGPAWPLPARARIRPARHGALRPGSGPNGCGPRLATGYQLGSRGLKAVGDREAVPAGAGAVYSTTGDMARYAAALLGGGAGEHGRLQPETLATMFQPHYQPDPRIPGMGLGFFRGQRRRAPDRRSRRDLDRLPLRPAARPRPGHRRRRVRQHRAVQPAGRAGPGRPRGPAQPARSLRRRRARRRPRAARGLERPVRPVLPRARLLTDPQPRTARRPGGRRPPRPPGHARADPGPRGPPGTAPAIPTATTRSPSASSSPGSGRAPPRSCSAAAPPVRSRPCTSEFSRCPSASGPASRTPDPGRPRAAAGALAIAVACRPRHERAGSD